MMDWVLPYLSIPWQEKGRTEAGCDCYGLVRLVLAERWKIYLDREDQFYTSIDEDREKIAGRMHEASLAWPWKKIEDRTQYQGGDVALFRVTLTRWHCGVLITPTEMLHIRQILPCVESLKSVLWAKRLEGVYRYAA